MRKAVKILSMIVVLSMLLSMSAYAAPVSGSDLPVASEDASEAEPVPAEDAEVTGEAEPAEEAENDASLPAPIDLPTGETVQADSLPPSAYAALTGYTGRDSAGAIYVGQDVTGGSDIALDQTVVGEGYTAVYAHGPEASASITGTLAVYDSAAGENASGLTGQGAALVAHDGAVMTVSGGIIGAAGLGRAGLVVSDGATVTLTDTQLTVLGGNAAEDYENTADMAAPPWGLGIAGGARAVSMVGQGPALDLVRTGVTAGGWGGISTDVSGHASVTTVDSDIRLLPSALGGAQSGWAMLGCGSGAYGSGYGTAYTGMSDQYHYGLTVSGATYGALLSGAGTAYYGASEGTLPLYDAAGELTGAEEGAGRPSSIHSVFGFLMAGDVSDGVYVEGGSQVETAGATVLYKDGNGGFFFRNAVLRPADGVLVQMIDDDNDGRIGDSRTYSDEKIGAAPGFPGLSAPLAPEGQVPSGEETAPGEDQLSVDEPMPIEEAPEEEAAPEEEVTSEDEAAPEEGHFPADMPAPVEDAPEEEPVIDLDGLMGHGPAVPAPDGGAHRLSVTFTNGAYKGDLYNGTGYYGQSGDVLCLTVGAGALLNGDAALTSIVKAIPYSDKAMEAIAACGEDVQYVLLNAAGQPTDGSEDDAAYIQFTGYTADQYYLQGHVQNMLFANGSAAIDVTVEAGGVWVIGEQSLISGLTMADGGTVYGAVTENADGTLTLLPAAEPLAPGAYGRAADAPDPGLLEEGPAEPAEEAADEAMTELEEDPVPEGAQEPADDTADDTNDAPAAEQPGVKDALEDKAADGEADGDEFAALAEDPIPGSAQAPVKKASPADRAIPRERAAAKNSSTAKAAATEPEVLDRNAAISGAAMTLGLYMIDAVGYARPASLAALFVLGRL